MKIKCLHGYFKFYPSASYEVNDFRTLYGLELEPIDDYYTFESLLEAKDYSIKGASYMDSVAIKTFEGPPWEVMRKNKLVYTFSDDLVQPVTTVTKSISIGQAGKYFLCNGLILPGSVTDDGSRVTDYTAWFFKGDTSIRYSEVDYE